MKHALQAALLAVLLSPASTLAREAGQDSVWRNPQNSVHIRTRSCGESRCGVVVWANDKAKADSARGGTTDLVGAELFRDFRHVSLKVWKGKVFVPDVNRTFTGTITIEDQRTAVARGCLIGRIGCKSQTWTRVE